MTTDDETEYRIVRKLGEGGFGQVFLIEHTKDPSVKNAMKIMNVADMDEYEVKMALQEVNLLSSLSHKHLLKYVECFHQDENVCVVTEFCPNGDLGDYIENQRGTKLEESRLIAWFNQIGSAVDYLHGKNIIHRDLKVQNVFLNDNMDCVLGDLGIARKLETSADFASTQVGTLHYMSPELFMGIPYNFKTDIWSLAVLIYELAALEKPFDSFFVPGLIFKVTQGQKPDMPEGYCSDFTDLLSTMMEKDPDNRPSSSQMMNHNLFKRKVTPRPMPKPKEEPGGSDEMFESAFLVNFLATFSKLTRRWLEDYVPSPQVDLSALHEDDEDPPEMAHVTRTLKSMGLFGPEKAYEGGRTGRIQKQVDQLKIYCVHVLDNDESLFNKVCKELDKSNDDEELEEKLIRLLGYEKFGMCGLQLLHYKNYSYNLRHKF